jgi:ferritin-like metal-binding protein YciE
MDTQLADSTKGILIDGLRNAYALEKEALSIMGNQVDRLEHYQPLQARLRDHIEETKTQLDRLEEALSLLGEGASTFKNITTKLLGNAAAFGHAPATDEVLKNTFADLAFENYEIASYKSLIAMADATGDNRILELCRSNLTEEEAMARWLTDHVDEITRDYLRRAATGDQAKR